jgi:hypothetical protein
MSHDVTQSKVNDHKFEAEAILLNYFAFSPTMDINKLERLSLFGLV